MRNPRNTEVNPFWELWSVEKMRLPVLRYISNSFLARNFVRVSKQKGEGTKWKFGVSSVPPSFCPKLFFCKTTKENVSTFMFHWDLTVCVVRMFFVPLRKKVWTTRLWVFQLIFLGPILWSGLLIKQEGAPNSEGPLLGGWGLMSRPKEWTVRKRTF